MESMKNKAIKKLRKYLLNELKNDIEILEDIYGDLYCLYKGQKVKISLNNESSLVFSTNASGKNIVRELISELNSFMKSAPICEYDYIFSDVKLDKEDLDIVNFRVEWETKNPDKRIRELTKGTSLSYYEKIENLVELYETMNKKLSRLEITKFSSVLFGSDHIGTSEFEKRLTVCKEEELFLILRTMSRVQTYVWNHSWNDYIPDPTDLSYAIYLAIDETKKFLGELSNELEDETEDIGSATRKTAEYTAWYSWWDTYFTLEKHMEYMEKRLNQEDVSEFLPEGNWTDLLEKPVQKNLKQ